MSVGPTGKRTKRPVSRKKRAQLFESLENRQLFSVITVTDYGAVANDGNDDSGTIQKALDASRDNDTILFPGGVFDIKAEMKTWPADRTYQGQGDATLRGKTSKGQLVSFRGDDITITGLTFDGGGLFFDRPKGFNENINIDNNVFKVNTSGVNPNGITFSSGLKHSDITNNLFTGYSAAFGIYGYNYNGLTIANNEFTNITAGMHIDAFTNSGHLLVEQNFITGAKRMGMEFQSTASDLVFQDNWFEHPNLSATRKNNDGSMAFSLILDKSSNIEIRRNVVIAPERPDGIGCRIAFEVGGDNTVVEDNYVDGINHVLAVNDGVGTCSVVAKNNVFKNYREGPRISFPSSNPRRSYEQSNNGPNTKLTWDLSRGTPGRNHRYQDAGSPTPPQNTPEPTPDLPQDQPTTPTEPTDAPTEPTDTPTLPTEPTTPPDSTPTEPTDTPTLPTEPTPDEPTDPTEEPTTPEIPPFTNSPTPPPDEVPPVVNEPPPVVNEPPPEVDTPPPPVVPKPKPAPPPVAAPTRLVAKVSGTTVKLSWTDNSNNENGFKVERSLDGVNWGQVAVLAAGTLAYTDDRLPPGLKIYYRVRAFNSIGQSANSNTVAPTTASPTNPASVSGRTTVVSVMGI